MASKRQVINLPGRSGKHSSPMAVKIGSMVLSSTITGMETGTGEVAEGAERQIEQAFENMRTLVERAGGQLGDIGHVTTLVRDYGAMAVIAKKWSEVFPQENNQPARHAMALGLSAGNLVQLHILSLLTSP